MRRILAVLLIAILAVALVAGCSSPNQSGRYVPISRGDGYEDMVLDTQTGRVWAYSKFGNEYIWIASTESIPDVPIGKEHPPPPPPSAATPVDR